MRFINIFIILGFSIFTLSQDIDKDYLESLPIEIREDLIERANEKSDTEKKVYRSSENSSKIKKEVTEEEVEIFGKSFFRTIQTSFMPTNEPNLDDSYVLDYGDSLSIQLIGSVDSIDEYSISRSGVINLIGIGELNLAGLTLLEATSLIKTKIEQTYIGTKVYVSLARLRDINVLVSGNAHSQGIYTLSGNSNMLHAISVAGGINDYGSYRSIKLIRDEKVIEILDLYDLLIHGSFNIGTRLNSGDIIFVDFRKNVVAIDGAVKRPGLYELNDEQVLSDVIDYANGLSIYADMKNMKLSRPLDGEIRNIPVVSLSQFKNIKAIDGDTLFFREHNYREVKISGAVLNPSTYLMTDDETLFDLIRKAGGYTNNADPFGAVYNNKLALSKNIAAQAVLYTQFLDGVLELLENNPTNQLDVEVLLSLAQSIKESEPNGRILINLMEEDPSNPLYVKDKDELIIPEKTNNVFIFGEVSNEGPLQYEKNSSYESYIKKAAGLKKTADDQAIYILLPNGETFNISMKRNIFASSPISDIEILPGSIIFVPRKIANSYNATMTAQAYATILGQIGVSLASLSVLNK